MGTMPAPGRPHEFPTTGPMLAPGALLLRRDRTTLQIGTAPGVRVRDQPGLGRLLRLLDGSLPLDRLAEVVARDVPEFTADLSDTIARLISAGAVVDRRSARPDLRVAVRADRSTGWLGARLTEALAPPGLAPDVEVLLSAGEPARSGIENLRIAGVAHLPVVLDERRVRIGPFVVPGVTSCLTCLDELLADQDPAWAALVPQFERPRLLPLALPHRLLLQAAAEVLHELESLGAGERPSTSGAVLSLGPGHGDSDLRTVPFAAGCPCGLLVA